MVTAEKYDKGITTIQITTKTLKRLRIIKAEHDYSTFEDVINDGLNFLEDKKLKNYEFYQQSKLLKQLEEKKWKKK